MKKFPKLDEYSNDDLIIIVYSEKELWQKEAITYAKHLLEKRGIIEAQAKERHGELEDIAEELWKQEIEARKVESYSIISIIFMWIFWPKYILFDWDLRQQGYYKKVKQRRIIFGSAILFWTIYILIIQFSFDKLEKERVNMINKIAYQDSIEKSIIDWSGYYQFMDVNETHNSKYISWSLDIGKTKKGHFGKLEINNNNLTQTINVSCVLTDNGIEFYPDTIYKVLDKVEIAYYDNLFTLIEKDSTLLTYWYRLKPFELNEYVNGNIYFKKINNQ